VYSIAPTTKTGAKDRETARSSEFAPTRDSTKCEFQLSVPLFFIPFNNEPYITAISSILLPFFFGDFHRNGIGVGKTK
jgi:hypothetical protein